MKYQLVILVVFLGLLNNSNCIFLNLESKERYCFKVDLKNEESLKINYVVSGKNEDNLDMTLWEDMELRGKPVYKSSKQKEHTYKHVATSNSPVKVCFQATDNKKKVLSFFFTKKDQEFANSDQLSDLKNDARDTYKELDKIYKNQRHQSVRERVHKEVLDSTDNKVRWCSMIKLIIIMGICAAQILILKGFFKGEKQSFGV